MGIHRQRNADDILAISEVAFLEVGYEYEASSSHIKYDGVDALFRFLLSIQFGYDGMMVYLLPSSLPRTL